jgi:hypothetical protein
MNHLAHKRWQGLWLTALGVVSLLAAVWTVFGRMEPSGSFDHPARISYYQQTVLLLVVGIAGGTIPLLFGRRIAPAWLRRTSLALAVLGMGIAGGFLLILIGGCGVTVLWGFCHP